MNKPAAVAFVPIGEPANHQRVNRVEGLDQLQAVAFVLIGEPADHQRVNRVEGPTGPDSTSGTTWRVGSRR